ncbi:MAG: Zn-ribbon domain-containing OB-fold protein [Candidatus Abyssobacteria bacterium SURF_17]|uniref:Zn-ribbon domain-containing OB-fold protein n=1 Tax=Candidatus Abyssobacteria bacterium SURF_17 TaxID=2093361 RepID=A0A419ET24_9BACT|nr:MAG: Zn-ribbon domain-containing OB-fold protein [Candidatus Abyssubacteria bacterium SURF_17]
MAKAKGGVEEMVLKGKIKVPYTWYVGECASRFYVELRDNKRIFGTKCAKCNKVIVPPRSSCGKCFVPITEWVEVKDTGVVQTYTVVHYAVPGIQPLKPPYAYGIIKLDGADTGFVHVIVGADLTALKAGTRVKAVFKEERQGNMLDIQYFTPV